jgi:hypothetical protein
VTSRPAPQHGRNSRADRPSVTSEVHRCMLQTGIFDHCSHSYLIRLDEDARRRYPGNSVGCARLKCNSKPAHALSCFPRFHASLSECSSHNAAHIITLAPALICEANARTDEIPNLLIPSKDYRYWPIERSMLIVNSVINSLPAQL